MSTEQVQVQATSVPRFEAVFERQLRRAIGRVRFLDVAAALLGLAAGTLLYALIVVTLDRWLVLSGVARQAAFIPDGVELPAAQRDHLHPALLPLDLAGLLTL